MRLRDRDRMHMSTYCKKIFPTLLLFILLINILNVGLGDDLTAQSESKEHFLNEILMENPDIEPALIHKMSMKIDDFQQTNHTIDISAICPSNKTILHVFITIENGSGTSQTLTYGRPSSGEDIWKNLTEKITLKDFYENDYKSPVEIVDIFLKDNKEKNWNFDVEKEAGVTTANLDMTRGGKNWHVDIDEKYYPRKNATSLDLEDSHICIVKYSLDGEFKGIKVFREDRSDSSGFSIVLIGVIVTVIVLSYLIVRSVVSGNSNEGSKKR